LFRFINRKFWHIMYDVSHSGVVNSPFKKMNSVNFKNTYHRRPKITLLTLKLASNTISIIIPTWGPDHDEAQPWLLSWFGTKIKITIHAFSLQEDEQQKTTNLK
jgi:hypothetical protein